jgi:hypothetical protein
VGKSGYHQVVTQDLTSTKRVVPPETELARELRERFEAAYDEDGVDRSLIRYCLSQSVTERVRAVEETLNALGTVRLIERAR